MSTDESRDVSVVLPENATIKNIREVQSCLVLNAKASQGQDHWTIDASNVQSIDTAGLQLCLALDRELKAKPVKPTWNGSKVFKRVADDLGLTQQLDGI